MITCKSSLHELMLQICYFCCQTARLITIGGTTLEVRVPRMMAHLLSNELASGLGWKKE